MIPKVRAFSVVLDVSVLLEREGAGVEALFTQLTHCFGGTSHLDYHTAGLDDTILSR